MTASVREAPTNTNTGLGYLAQAEVGAPGAELIAAVDQGPITPETDTTAAPANLQDRKLSRREVLRMALLTVAVVGGAAKLFEAAKGVSEGADFVDHAPDYASRPNVTRLIGYGDMTKPAREGYQYGHLVFGDSVAWGWNHGEQVCPAQIVASDINHSMAASGAHASNGDRSGIYWGNLMYAQPGVTTEQVAGQVHRFTEMMAEYPAYKGPWEIEVSMGGNDALNYLTEHVSPGKILSLISDFDGFLAHFEAQSRGIMQELASLKHTPGMQGLERVAITGLPDIGRSAELWYMRISPVRSIATAACKYMNEILARVAQEVSQETGMEFEVDDMFGLPVSDIHPTEKGYMQAAERRERRRIGTFPDGTRTFREEAEEHGIAPRQPAYIATALS